MNFKQVWKEWFSKINYISDAEFDAKTPAQLDDMKKDLIDFFHERLDSSWTEGRLTYNQLDDVLGLTLSHFKYTSDEVRHGKDDYWSTKTMLELFYTKFLNDDCDSFRALIAIMYYLLNYDKNDCYEASCRTETGEGHHVSWFRCKSGIIYQLENRIRRPRTLNYMLDKGYEYWHYRPMSKVGKWFNAEPFIAKQLIVNSKIHNTVDSSKMGTFDAVNYIDKSDTLKLSGGTIAVSSVGAVTALASQQDWKVVALLTVMMGMGMAFWYLRAKTTKPLGSK